MEWLIILFGALGIGYIFGQATNKSPQANIHKTDDKKIIQTVAKKLNTEQTNLSTIELGEEQRQIFEVLNTTMQSAYITGKAGTGKSVLLQYFVANTAKNAVVVAPTGVAALNVSGQTIHSFFRLSWDTQDTTKITVGYKLKELLRHVDTIVIDEVSMVRADLIEAINKKLQVARNNDLPFGGVQIIMFGDLYQLPPVVTDGELQRFFDHNYGGIYFFNAPALQELKYEKYELSKIYRQKDKNFIELLNQIRLGKVSEQTLEEINKRVTEPPEEGGYITLAGHNDTVTQINHSELSKLEGREMTYQATITGDLNEKSYPTEKLLRLKVGAQVMLLKNDKQKPSRWVNGTLGIVTQLTEDVIRVNINGVEHTVPKETWESVRYYYNPEERKLEKEVVNTFTQFPLRLAWAITIHKSQGQTYQTVAIDVSQRAFAHGQMYVALSRCQTLEGIYLKSPIKREDVIVDPKVIEFMSIPKQYS
jgi:ATP-dependent exoDNAse (exonuclease V) alpha subunit